MDWRGPFLFSVMASVRVDHICEARVKLPTEGIGIVLVFLLAGWAKTFSLNDELPQGSSVAFV